MKFQLRFAIALLGIYACSLVYVHRAGFSVAVVAMTKKNHSTFNDSSRSNASNTDPISSDDKFYDWDETLQGIILGAQFYMYIFVPTFAGRLTDAIGGKWIAFYGALGPCILAAITPTIVNLWGPYALIVNRILVGFFHGFTYATMFSLFIKWFPKKELSVANGGLAFGGSLGSTIMSAMSGAIAEYWSWPWIFYAMALFHVPFLVLWFYLATNSPETNRLISDDERRYIEQNVQQKIISKKVKVPWIRMITSIPVICSLITKMCSGFGYFLLITKMPSYLSKVFNIDLFKNGWVFAGTNLANGMATLIAPPLANLIIEKCGWKNLCVRKLFQSIALFGPAICLGLIPVIGLHPDPIIALLISAMMLYGFFSAGEWTIIAEYAPNFAGTVFGFANILAFSMGIIAPYIVGVLLDSQIDNDHQQWNIIFYIAVIIYVIGGSTFVLCATDKQQDWDRQAVLDVMEDSHQSKLDRHKTKNNPEKLANKSDALDNNSRADDDDNIL
ncbi:Sialin [Sarcoptes scabiei]|uniref:Sialin n=1 Tax=Sarcoptes scabiei TaxID=52283 RepID=A0A834RBY4_SARSC|nr:Sialin [Sarcoptes scabiei]UXI22684.1 Amine oxidase [Sarcoptes scabiei]